jgi:zinc protease
MALSPAFGYFSSIFRAWRRFLFPDNRSLRNVMFESGENTVISCSDAVSLLFLPDLGANSEKMINTINETEPSNQVAITKVSEDKNVVEYRLPNGLKVLLLENHTAPVVTVLVLYKVGSRNEGVGYTGSTHFLEHMLFKGTKKHNPDKGNGIDDLLTQIGAYWNATTWFDRTSYFEVVPAEYLELCVELEADRMRNLLLRQIDHDSEMSVVRNELERGENYPEEALEKDLYALAFREHPYHHPTIGWRTDVEGVPMDRLREFYNTFYWPDNATVVLVGDFKTEEALSVVSKHYGKIPAAPHPIPQVYTTEPPQEGERRFEINRAGDLARILIGYHVPEATHRDNYALAALRHILGSTYERSSCLYKILIDTSLAAETFARHDDLRDPGLFIIGATVTEDIEVKQVEDAIYAELERLSHELVSEDELNRAKSSNRKGTILAKADPSSLAFMLGEAESKADWHWLMDYDDKFDQVTPEDVRRVVATYFNRTNRTVGTFIPKEIEMSPEQMQAAMEAAEAQAELESVLDAKHDLAELMADKPVVAKAKVKKPKIHTSSFASRLVKKVLPNGLTVLLMQNSGTESVGICGILKAGKYFTTDGNKNSNLAELVADLLPKGSLRYSKMQIAQALESMGIAGGLEFSVDNYRLSFGTHVVSDDLPMYLDLLADLIRNPELSSEELAKTKIEWRSRFTEALNNTRSMAWNKMRRTIFDESHPFFEKTFEEQMIDLEEVSLETVHEAHKRLFTPKGMIITVVGDTDLEEAFQHISDKFGDWQGADPPSVNIPQAPLPKKSTRIDVAIPEKKSTDIVIAHPTDLQRTGKDFYAAKLANAALGQDTITSRLGNVVRDRAGLTYGIYSAFSDTAFGSAPWSVSLSVNPKNVEKSLDLVSQVLSDYIENGISAEELSKETGRAVGAFTVGLASSLGVARALTEFEFLNLGPEELDNMAKNYAAVTKAQVDEAMKKYFHPEKAVTVVSGTFDK